VTPQSFAIHDLETALNRSNHSREELRFQLIVLVLAAVAGFGCWLVAAALSRHDALRGLPPDKPRQLEDFSLTDSTGRAVTRAELDGKILAVSFLFTGCGLTCPEVSQRMAEIQRLTTNQPDVRLVSLTVDPHSDTPPVLAKWGARYGADTNRWLLLTGSKAVLQQLIGASFLATDAGDPFNSMPCNFTGTERIAVVDKHGRLRIFFDGLQLETSAAVVAEIAQLRKED
jgi:cytochrome oxidase Cu insertion factor (SCO1/SenC/PrrC family)